MRWEDIVDDVDTKPKYEFEGKLYYNPNDAINAKIREIADSGITAARCDERRKSLEAGADDDGEEATGDDEGEFMPDAPPASYVLHAAYIHAYQKILNRESEAKWREQRKAQGPTASPMSYGTPEEVRYALNHPDPRAKAILAAAHENTKDADEWDALVAEDERKCAESRHSAPVAESAVPESTCEGVSEEATGHELRDMSSPNYNPFNDPDVIGLDGDINYLSLERKAYTWYREDKKPIGAMAMGGNSRTQEIMMKLLDPDYYGPADDSGAGGAAGEASKKSEWAEGWYYIASRDRVVRPGERTTYSKQGFDAAQATNLPDAKSVFDFVKKKIGFTIVDGVAYAAGLPPVYSHEGRRFVNEYLESSVPKAATEFTEKGLEAIETFKAHIGLICHGDEDLTHKLISWVALNVQKPGEIIGCTPLIKGIQGDGKTIVFMEAMKSVMGGENVGEVSAKELNSDFNAYAYGRAVRVFEELKAAGLNRVANENSMRTLITNRSVRVVGKNKDGVDVPNRTNYVGLTNHEDALPLKDTDRRWWVIFTPWRHIGELTEKVGGDLDAYMEKLAYACLNNGPQLRKFLLEYRCHAEIKHNMRAPDTIWKRAMIAAEQNSNGGDLLDAFIEGDEVGVSLKVISTDHLTRLYKLFSTEYKNIPRTRQITDLLESRGWVRVGDKVKWMGWPRTVYVKDGNILKMGDLRNKEVCRLLNETLPENWREGEDWEKRAREKEKELRISGKSRHDF